MLKADWSIFLFFILAVFSIWRSATNERSKTSQRNSTMHRVYLSKLLKKFKKDELLDVLSQKGYLDDSSLEKSTKATIINRVLKRCEGKLTKRQIAELDLICKY